MRKLLLALGVLAASLTATGAVAQPTTTCVPAGSGGGCVPLPNPAPTFASQDLGLKPCPSTFDISFTLFRDNEMTTSEIDGVNGDDQRATNGVVTKAVETLCPVAAPSALSTGRPLAATGLKRFAQAVTFGRIRVNGRLYPPKPLGATHTITVRGIGANGAPRTVTATFRLSRGGTTTTRSGLARTGTFALQWSPLGIGLLGVGYLLVLASRRKRSAA